MNVDLDRPHDNLDDRTRPRLEPKPSTSTIQERDRHSAGVAAVARA
jgi:hypothetical protein